ncbi:glycoside hydrolase family 2 TIM barrel-domain containing protein [Alteromonas sp. AMM-1]|uniref:glycoside hydrolase family 2 TIM barrel-domain containing protein n=1 Tax=Alteromonas sp. AMM-1 TaxID=3394233 RepID=UPI0039A6078B
MKTQHTLWLVAITLLVLFGFTQCRTTEQTATQANAESLNMYSDWHFMLDDNPEFKQADFNDNTWRRVTLPHDWSIEDIPGTQSPFSAAAKDAYNTGYAVGGTGWYRKHLPGIDSGKQYLLEFDGVYMNATVYVNGQEAAQHYYGYTGFQVDITPFLHPGQGNVVAVRVHNNEQNSRWYSGSGLYRQVTLHTLSASHIARWGTSVITQAGNQSDSAVLVVNTALQRDEIDKAGGLTLEQAVKLNGKTLLTQRVPVSSDNISQTININQPHWWEPASPVLYTLSQRLLKDGEVIDNMDTRFGIRTVALSPEQGFLLNNKPVLLKGMNIHHDNYLLGAAAHPKAERRKVLSILNAGYNAVRSAHNPPSSAFLAAADELGLLVISEAFDAWNKRKWENKNDYSFVFSSNWQGDLTDFIARDINHPSVVMWSLGNEIPEQGDALGAQTAKQLTDFVRKLDASRPLTVGANMSGEHARAYLSAFDVSGYNYEPGNYVHDFNAGISAVMYGSETYSKDAFAYWQYVEDYPYVIGDFVWTGWDYVGEASIGWTGYAPEWAGLAPFPWTLAYTGEIDVLGNWRPAAFYRQVLWHTGQHGISAFVQSPSPSLSPTPNPTWYDYWTFPDIHPSWSWPGQEGKSLEVTVYSVYPGVELWLNNTLIGTAQAGKQNQYIAKFTVNYVHGTLVAKGLDISGNVQEAWQLTTAGPATAIAISREDQQLRADGLDINYLPIQLLDEAGNSIYHWEQDQALTVKVEGAATLMALGNARPDSAESFKQPFRHTFRGKLMAVVQSTGTEGDVVVTVSGQGLKPASIRFNAQ